MIDIAPLWFFDVVERALADDWEAVADYVQGGGEITTALRPLLAERVRSGKRKSWRPTRSYRQRIEQLRIVQQVRSLQRANALVYGAAGSLAAAKNRYLDIVAENGRSLSPATLNNYLRENGGGLTDDELLRLEQQRAELVEEGVLQPMKRPRRSNK